MDARAGSQRIRAGGHGLVAPIQDAVHINNEVGDLRERLHKIRSTIWLLRWIGRRLANSRQRQFERRKLFATGAPPIIALICPRRPAALKASMVVFIAGMVVV